jgi:hypothetical protein
MKIKPSVRHVKLKLILILVCCVGVLSIPYFLLPSNVKKDNAQDGGDEDPGTGDEGDGGDEGDDGDDGDEGDEGDEGDDGDEGDGGDEDPGEGDVKYNNLGTN